MRTEKRLLKSVEDVYSRWFLSIRILSPQAVHYSKLQTPSPSEFVSVGREPNPTGDGVDSPIIMSL